MSNLIIITEAHECLPFHELEEGVQQRVIEKYNDWFTAHDWWDCTYEWFIETCRETYGVEVHSRGITFRGFWSQGDGAAFTGKVTDIDKFLSRAPCSARACKDTSIYHRVIRHMFNECGLSLSTTPTGFYQTSQASAVERYNVNPHEYQGTRQMKHYEHAENALDWLEHAWEDICIDLASTLYQHLEQEYEDLTSVEALAENFNTNECVFEIKTGKMYHQ